MKYIFKLFVILLSIEGLYSQTRFIKNINIAQHEFTTKMIQVSNGFLIVGYVDNGVNSYDFLAIKVDTLGSVMWSKSYGTESDDKALSAIETADHGYILAGYSSGQDTVGTDSTNVCLLKLDSLGNMQWSKLYGGNGKDGALGINKTSSGDLIVCGFTKSNSTGFTDKLVLKTDPFGQIIWSKAIGKTNSSDSSYSIIETTTGDILLAGFTSFGASTLANITKLNASGTVLWNKEIEFMVSYSVKRRLSYDIIENHNGDYVVTGGVGVGDIPLDGQPYLLKMNPSGNIISTNRYIINSGVCIGYHLKQTPDKGYIVTGWMSYFGNFVFKTDSNGIRLWSKSYYWGIGNDIIPITNGYLFTINSEVNNDSTILLVKTNALGEICYANDGLSLSTLSTNVISNDVPNVVLTNQLSQFLANFTENNVITNVTNICQITEKEELYHFKNLKIYPNPSSTVTNIDWGFNVKNAQIQIENYLGQLVNCIQVSGTSFTLNHDSLPPGIYLIKFIYQDNLSTTKLIIH